MSRLSQLERENRLLRKQVERIPVLEKELQAALEAVAKLSSQIEWFKRQMHGRRSERWTDQASGDQPDLFGEEDLPGKQPEPEPGSDANGQEDEAVIKRPGKKRKVRADRLPENVRIVEAPPVIPDEVLRNPGQWREMGEPDVSYKLEIHPGYLFKVKITRPKFVRVDAPFEAPVQAPAAPSLVPGSFFGSSLQARVLIDKFFYHLPVYRQQEIFKNRYGVCLARSSLNDCVHAVGEQLKIVLRRTKVHLIKNRYVQADETPTRYLDRNHTKGSALGRLWVYHCPRTRLVIYDWQKTREYRHAFEWLGPEYSGRLQSDAYGAYDAYVLAQRQRGKEVIRLGCLAHVRRKFETAAEHRPKIAGWFMRQFKRIYQIEDMLRQHEAGEDVRERVRANTCLRIAKLIARAAQHLLGPSGRLILPRERLGQALRYTVSEAPAIEACLDNGIAEPDNNLAENAIRPAAVGRKNWLFVGAPDAGDAMATVYSLIVSARNQGVDPEIYLRDVIERLPHIKANDLEALDALTPHIWARDYRKKQAEDDPHTAAA